MAKMSLLTAPSKPIGQLTGLAPAAEIWYDGSPISGTAVTSATMQYTTNALTLSVNGSGDSRIGSSGVIDCTDGAYDTFGELEKAINAVPGWHCRLLGALAADSTNATVEDSGSALGCLKTTQKLLIDTSALLTHGFCITNASIPVAPAENKRKAIYDERGAVNCLFYLYYVATFSADSGDTMTMTIYSVDRANDTETLLGSIVLAATTVANELDFTNMPITSRYNEQLVIRFTAGGTNPVFTAVTSAVVNGKSIRM